MIICRELLIGYEKKALTAPLDFTVRTGDYLCVIGENGAGKSTLIKTVLGLQQPICGTVCFEEGFQKNEIGYLPQQNVFQKDFPASVREIVRSGCQSFSKFRPYYQRKEKRMAKDAMEKMGILALEHRCYRELSGGQQQRVLLARAIAAPRKLLVLDEPISGLDPKTAEELYQLLYEFNKKEKMTIIMISHDVDTAVRYANKILHIGKEYYFGTAEIYQRKFKESVMNSEGREQTGDVKGNGI